MYEVGKVKARIFRYEPNQMAWQTIERPPESLAEFLGRVHFVSATATGSLQPAQEMRMVIFYVEPEAGGR